jgi:hypothetical protein
MRWRDIPDVGYDSRQPDGPGGAQVDHRFWSRLWICLAVRLESPESRGGEVGRDRRLAGGEDGGHYGGLPRRLVTGEQIHAAAEPDQSAGGHRPCNRPGGQAGLCELPCRNQAQLAASEQVDLVLLQARHYQELGRTL